MQPFVGGKFVYRQKRDKNADQRKRKGYQDGGGRGKKRGRQAQCGLYHLAGLVLCEPPFRPCTECCSGQPEKDAAVKLDQIPRGWLGPGLPFFFFFFFLDVSSP